MSRPKGVFEAEYQKQLRAERRQHKRKPRHQADEKPKDYSFGKLVLAIKGDREIAFQDLMVASTLRTYFPDVCRTPGARRKVVLEGRIELEGPRMILDQIEHELRAGWRRGKLNDD